MKRLLFAPYKLGSEGARSLAQALGGKCTKAEKRLKRDVMLINWGRSDLVVRGQPSRILNPPDRVAVATNKLTCLRQLKDRGVSCVDFTTDLNVVEGWLANNEVVYGRKVLSGSQGDGIVVVKNINRITACPLYTKGVVKSHEYRVHIFRDKVMDVTKKRRRTEAETNDYIKNLENGWVYCRENIEIPDNLLECAKQAVIAIGLDFGAVDILYKKGVPYVLEINTAPGLEGTTLDRYIEHFRTLKYQ